MSVNGRGATAPDLNNADENSLREFWDVYESQFAEIGAELADDPAAHPELASFVGAGDEASVAENRERIAQAINDGDWDAYLSDMVDTGARYAEAGLSFSAWFATGRALRSKLVPLLIDALGDEPERLADALRGVSIFIDLVIQAVADSFIDAKQRIILEQQDVLRGLSIPTLKHGRTLIVSLQSEPTDAEFVELQHELAQRVTTTHANGVLIDVTALEVLDSFATRTLREIGQTVTLCGARSAIVGVQPEVAFAMAQLGLSLNGTLTALDLEDGLARLHAQPSVGVVT